MDNEKLLLKILLDRMSKQDVVDLLLETMAANSDAAQVSSLKDQLAQKEKEITSLKADFLEIQKERAQLEIKFHVAEDQLEAKENIIKEQQLVISKLKDQLKDQLAIKPEREDPKNNASNPDFEVAQSIPEANAPTSGHDVIKEAIDSGMYDNDQLESWKQLYDSDEIVDATLKATTEQRPMEEILREVDNKPGEQLTGIPNPKSHMRDVDSE